MQTCLVNLFHLDPAPNGGSSRVAKEVSQMLAGYAKANQLHVIFAVGWRFADKFPTWLEDYQVDVIPCLPEVGLTPLFEAIQPDILVSPLFGMTPFDHPNDYRGIPHIAVMPDVALTLVRPDLFSPEEVQQRKKLYTQLRHASRVVTLSEYSRQCLIHHIGLLPQQTVVIPAAGDHLIGSQTQALGIDVSHPYVFYPANGWPHKRHALLIQIMGEVWKVRPELKLVLAGWHEPGFIIGLAEHYQCPQNQIIDLGYVSDGQLVALYRQAEALLFVSEYEAFGIPLLEAMANGCPVICAPLAAIPEVASEAALYVNSTKPIDWATAFLEALPAQRLKLIEKGLLRAQMFTWTQIRLKWQQVLTEVGLQLAPLGQQKEEMMLPLSVVTQELALWSRHYTTDQADLNAKEAAIQALASATQAQASQLVAKEAMIQTLRSEWVAAREELIQAQQGQLAAQEEIIQMLWGELTARDEVQTLHNESVAQEEMIQTLQSELASKEKIIQTLQSQLTGKEEVIQSQQDELIAKEQVIQSLIIFQRSSLHYWTWRLIQLCLKKLTSLQTQDKLRQLYRRFFLGKLHQQYDPIPLKIPQRYHETPIPTNTILPLVSIVTPSFNHAQFLERTINSVIGQNYPNLEYIIQDGVSTDDTAQILEKYCPKFKHVESRQDKGQANALNLGFSHTAGDIMAWLNSDDLLLPGAISYVVNFFLKHPDIDVVYGHRININENDNEVGRWLLPAHDDQILLWADYIPQETLFWRRRVWDQVGGYIDESYQFALDWELLLRFRQAGAKFASLPRFLGAFRVHPAQKNITWYDIGQQEMARLRTQCHGREVIWLEIKHHTRSYLMRSARLYLLYRLGLLRH